MKTIQLQSISIRNYREIESLEITFNSNQMFAIGGGTGKTSVLECCALLSCFGLLKNKKFILENLELVNSLIKPNAQQLSISGIFELNSIQILTCIHINRDGELSIELSKFSDFSIGQVHNANEIFENIFSDDDHLKVLNPVLYFTSYRKVSKKNPTLTGDNVNPFKSLVVNALIENSKLFDHETNTPQSSLSILNEILKQFCSGVIKLLKPCEDNSLDIRISFEDGSTKSFNDLSRSHIEIISIIFQVWKHTYNNPQIVLIDEPELHLDDKLKISLLLQLQAFAPNNQYFFATYSQIILKTFDEKQKIYLPILLD